MSASFMLAAMPSRVFHRNSDRCVCSVTAKLPLLQVPKLKESVPVPTMASGDEKSAKARTCDEARLLTEISCENAEHPAH